MNTFEAGKYINQGRYRSFIPNEINREWSVSDGEILSLLSHAYHSLGKLDMFSEYVPNIDLFIWMHIAKEATQSSKIEGTQTSIEDVVMSHEDVALDKRDDWAEVHNYIHAMDFAIERLSQMPLSSRLIREVHATLLRGVRGKHKSPGEFRRSQNWIGGSNINDAIFIPPPDYEIARLMGDLELFIHSKDIFLPDLIKVAILHYQFETIHPFLDGNGRTGRLLITLYLVSSGVLKRPILYVSDYLESHRNSYYNALMGVREENDLQTWVKFFLKAVDITAQKGVKTLDSILKLQEVHKGKVRDSRRKYTEQVLSLIYKKAIVAVQDLEDLGISKSSAYDTLNHLRDVGILQELPNNKRGKLYIMRDYVALFG